MTTHTTHCSLRLGDNLAAVHFLRKCALQYPECQFRHYALADYVAQLADVVNDLKNISVGILEAVSIPSSSRWTMEPKADLHSTDLWKNAGGYWERHPLRWDYGQFMVMFFHWAAAQMGIDSPIRSTRDLLFDYPALKPAKPPCDPFDFLIVNSAPMSGQLPAYDESQFVELIAMLARKYHIVTTQRTSLAVTCTADYGLTVTQIGHLSQFCRAIVMVATGPAWTTFNPWNGERIETRVIISGYEEVNLAPRTVHVNKVYAVRDILMGAGWL